MSTVLVGLMRPQTTAIRVSRLTAANRNYANAPWYLRPVYWAQVVACRTALAAADARLTVVRTARDQGRAAIAVSTRQPTGARPGR